MLSVQMEQRVISSYLLNGKTFTEAYAMLKEMYGNACLSRTQVFEWFKWFKEGRETAEDDPPPDGPQRQKRTKTLKKTEHKLMIYKAKVNKKREGFKEISKTKN
ncbi:hypothetical protein NQ318_005994 [Aromia moschata]|uniref:Mos1 transposase HTH domain-containing protein n=1 Tax=Aromia moschata TaxID=1265417 RepID=A0AAV8XJQ7_9CUCU|nr:hypothetical protein NQ318_005994 [Aromia moschata]